MRSAGGSDREAPARLRPGSKLLEGGAQGGRAEDRDGGGGEEHRWGDLRWVLAAGLEIRRIRVNLRVRFRIKG